MRTILGIDPALRNTGFSLWEINEEKYSLGDKITGGTFTTRDTTTLIYDRLYAMSSNLPYLINKHNPDYISLEAPILYGPNRSETGIPLYTLMVAPLRNKKYRSLLRDDLNLQYITSFHPNRLSSLLISDGQKNTSKLNIVRYDRMTGTQDGKKITEHEIDSFFMCHYGIRFIKTILEGYWPKTILNDQERQAYLYASKESGEDISMKGQCGEAWWKFEN